MGVEGIRLGMSEREGGELSRINDREENIQSTREYFFKEKPGEKRKDREQTEEGILNSTKNNTEKDMGVGGKAKKVKRRKDSIRQENEKEIKRK